jgi:hypothetical protein
MTPQPTDTTWRQKLTLATITGLVSGIARALIAVALEHLVPHL